MFLGVWLDKSIQHLYTQSKLIPAHLGDRQSASAYAHKAASPCVRMLVRREIVCTAIAPCSDSVRRIQSPHTYKSQNSNMPWIRSPWLVTRCSLDSWLFVHAYIAVSEHVLPKCPLSKFHRVSPAKKLKIASQWKVVSPIKTRGATCNGRSLSISPKLYVALSNKSISLMWNLSGGGYITIIGWNISCFTIWKWVIEAIFQANGQLGRFVYASGVNVTV